MYEGGRGDQVPEMKYLSFYLLMIIKYNVLKQLHGHYWSI